MTVAIDQVVKGQAQVSDEQTRDDEASSSELCREARAAGQHDIRCSSRLPQIMMQKQQLRKL